MMDLLGITYDEYKDLHSQITSNITCMEFMIAIVSFIRKAQMLDMKESLVFLDEYTIIPKPFLLVMLMLLDYYKIGTVICGDKEQFENYQSSAHDIRSSYDIAQAFSIQSFQLYKNEQYSDARYNQFIDYLAQYSSDTPLDDYMYSMIAALFPKQLIELPQYNHIHLAGTHQELADCMHQFVRENNYLTESYYNDESTSNLLSTNAMLNDESPEIKKFLPYLPLVVGARYYVNKHSQYSQGRLVSINSDEGTLTMQMDNGVFMKVNKESDHSAMSSQHYEFLLNNSEGNFYCYPIYPTNFMTIHKYQGCTITENLDLMLNHTTYQGLYVALSRVTNPNQISRITIPNPITHLVSAIINFPELANNIPITIEILNNRMINFVQYIVNPFYLSKLCCEFISKEDVTIKNQIRNEIIAEAMKCQQKKLEPPKMNVDQEYNLTTIGKNLKYKDIFMALACIDEIDRNVWLHEFVLNNPDMLSLNEQHCGGEKEFNVNNMALYRKDNTLVTLAGLNDGYSLDISTVDYIRNRAISKYYELSNVQLQQDDEETIVEQILFSKFSKFCCKVYKKYKRNKPITVGWLVDELNVMLEDQCVE